MRKRPGGGGPSGVEGARSSKTTMCERRSCSTDLRVALDLLFLVLDVLFRGGDGDRFIGEDKGGDDDDVPLPWD